MKYLLRQFGLLSALVLWMAGIAFGSGDMRVEMDISAPDIQQEETWGFALDLGDVSDRSAADIDQEIQEFVEAQLATMSPDLNCKVSVTGKVTVGVASFNITVEVSGPCSKVRAQGRQIANQVLSELRQALR